MEGGWEKGVRMCVCVRAGGVSLSVHRTHMNGTNLAKKLYPNIFLLSPWETGDEAWSRVTGTSTQKKSKILGTLLPLGELGSRENSIKNQITLVFYVFVATLALSCNGESRALLLKQNRCLDLRQ